jgi:formiminotetrahydrofolate cyclodeaminase
LNNSNIYYYCNTKINLLLIETKEKQQKIVDKIKAKLDKQEEINKQIRQEINRIDEIIKKVIN